MGRCYISFFFSYMMSFLVSVVFWARKWMCHLFRIGLALKTVWEKGVNEFFKCDFFFFNAVYYPSLWFSHCTVHKGHNVYGHWLSLFFSLYFFFCSHLDCVQPCGINVQPITTALSLHLIFSREFLSTVLTRDEICNCASNVQSYQPLLSITN